MGKRKLAAAAATPAEQDLARLFDRLHISSAAMTALLQCCSTHCPQLQLPALRPRQVSVLPWCMLPHSCAAAANPAPWLLLVWPGTMATVSSRSTAPISPRASDATGSCRYHCLLFKQLEFDHIVKGIILQLIKLAIAGMSKAQRQAFRTRLMDTRRPRGFALTQDWCAGKDFKASTSGGKIHVTLQWFLHCSWADIAGLLTPVSEQLWCATPVAASAVHRPGH